MHEIGLDLPQEVAEFGLFPAHAPIFQPNRVLVYSCWIMPETCKGNHCHFVVRRGKISGPTFKMNMIRPSYKTDFHALAEVFFPMLPRPHAAPSPAPRTRNLHD